MRHRISGKKLGRTHHQRQALLKSLSKAIFTYGAINTTHAKAQAVIPLIEKLCRLCQKGDLNSRHRLFALFQDRTFTNQVITAVTLAFKDQTKNFTKARNVKKRQGDDALIVKLEFAKPYHLTPAPKADDIKKVGSKTKSVKKVKTKPDEK